MKTLHVMQNTSDSYDPYDELAVAIIEQAIDSLDANQGCSLYCGAGAAGADIPPMIRCAREENAVSTNSKNADSCYDIGCKITLAVTEADGKT